MLVRGYMLGEFVVVSIVGILVDSNVHFCVGCVWCVGILCLVSEC